MDHLRVVIAGGGVAALEGLLRLRRLLGDAVDITLLAPNEDFAYRALSVKEPFAFGRAQRHPLREIAADNKAEWVQDRLERVDTDGQLVHTADGKPLPYDALLIAVGGVLEPAFDHVTTFRDADADEVFRGVIQDIEGGYTKSVAFLAPAGPTWPLPLYELALMTAERAHGMGFDDVTLSVVTPEPTPLASFGPEAGEAVRALLAEAGIALYTSAAALIPSAGHLVLQPSGMELHPGRMIAMPSVTGPEIGGLPRADGGGFIPIDEHCLVPDTGERVFAAGDATAVPVKHGGLGSQQADIAAAMVARLAGADVERPSFQPVIRGLLLTGRAPLYLSAHVVRDRGFDSQVSTEPLWSPAEKVASEELGPYLAGREAHA
jgi:sulfide:quinone oxidoreductase